MSYQQGLQIGNAYANMGATVAGAMNQQKRSAREDEELAFKREEQARKKDSWITEEATYEYADKLRQDSNWNPEAEAESANAALTTEEMPRAKNVNKKAWWQAQIKVIDEDVRKNQRTVSGANAIKAKIQQRETEGQGFSDQFEKARLAGNEQLARENFWEWQNLMLENGMTAGKVVDGKRELLKHDGTKIMVDEMTMDEMSSTISKHYAKSIEQRQKDMYRGIEGERLRRVEHMKNAKVYQNLKDPSKKLLAIGTGKGDVMYDPVTRKPIEGGIYTDNFDTNKTFEELNRVDFNPAEWKEDTEQKTGPELEKESLTREGLQTDINYKKAQTAKAERETAKPTEQIAGLKLKAWKAFLADKATGPQKKMIGVDKDPYVLQAAEMLKDDLLLEDDMNVKVQMIKDRANELRAAGGGNQGLATGGGKNITRTGKDKSGRKVVEYSDGSVEYAD